MNLIEKAFRSVLDRLNNKKEDKVKHEDIAKRFTAVVSIPDFIPSLPRFIRRGVERRKAQLRHQRARTRCKPGFERIMPRPHPKVETRVA